MSLLESEHLMRVATWTSDSQPFDLLYKALQDFLPSNIEIRHVRWVQSFIAGMGSLIFRASIMEGKT